MGARPKCSLRPVSQTARQTWHRVAKASSDRVDTLRRAKARLAVAGGERFTQAGRQAGLWREGVSHRVDRFNHRGLASLVIASGGGRKATYAAEARPQVVQTVQRQPDRLPDHPATWSLKRWQRPFRRTGVPAIGATTIGRILHEEGFSRHRDRPWCHAGSASRVRKKGVYRVQEPQAPGNKTERARLWQRRSLRAPVLVKGARPAPLPADRTRERIGSRRANQSGTRMNRCGKEASNCAPWFDRPLVRYAPKASPR